MLLAGRTGIGDGGQGGAWRKAAGEDCLELFLDKGLRIVARARVFQILSVSSLADCPYRLHQEPSDNFQLELLLLCFLTCAEHREV